MSLLLSRFSGSAVLRFFLHLIFLHSRVDTKVYLRRYEYHFIGLDIHGRQLLHYSGLDRLHFDCIISPVFTFHFNCTLFYLFFLVFLWRLFIITIISHGLSIQVHNSSPCMYNIGLRCLGETWVDTVDTVDLGVHIALCSQILDIILNLYKESCLDGLPT